MRIVTSLIVLLASSSSTVFAQTENNLSGHGAVMSQDANDGIETYGVPNGYMIIEGDILVPVDFFESSTLRGTFTSNLWPDGAVPFEFASGVTSTHQAAMQVAMSDWESVARVDFRPRAGEANYVFIKDDPGNWSSVGMVGGRQEMGIYNWDSEFVMAHELGHALGLWHEQSRADRDSYVRIVWDNITAGEEHNFESETSGHFGPYDFDSVMHYDQCAFSQCSNCPSDSGCADGGRTIVVLPPNQSWQGTIGQQTHLSYWDQATMVYLYGCPDCTDPPCDDCNNNGMDDECEIDNCVGDLACGDCNGNGIPDGCDIFECAGLFPECDDCNGNGVPDACDINAPHQVAKITAYDAATGDAFGVAVAVDDDTVVVGSFEDDRLGEDNAGSAYVFNRVGNAWTQVAALSQSTPLQHAYFGQSVALDQDTILVGAPDDGSGSVSVFSSNGIWEKTDELTASDAGGEFGVSVAVDGNTALIGAWFNEHSGVDFAGAAYVFNGSGGYFSEQAKLIAPDAATNDFFGWSVAVDGNTAIVGAFGDDHAGGANAGSAYVFTRSGIVWTQQAKLTADDAVGGEEFGYSVVLSGDTALVGAWRADPPGGNDAGAAYVFVRSGGAWSQQAKLTASDATPGSRFGSSVGLDGQIAVVGAPYDDHGTAADAGSAYVFSRSGNAWTETVKLIAADGADGDEFGHFVDLDGDMVVVGALHDDHGGGSGAGSAYLFALSHDADCNGNDIPDDCESDCNSNGIADECDMVDCSGNPSCEDCNGNGVPDGCDIAACGTDPSCRDCNGNGVPDACDIAACGADPTCQDCNGNGLPDGCELSEVVGSMYSSSPNVAIPDGDPAGVSDTITVPDSSTIEDLNVALSCTHTFFGDLCVTLTHPSGSPTVQLIARPGADNGVDVCHLGSPYGCPSNEFSIELDDQGTGGAVEDLCGAGSADPTPGSPPNFTPFESLDAFDGLDAAGDWTITVSDNADGDTGSLESWSLIFSTIVLDDCNNNSVLDECDMANCGGDPWCGDCDANGVLDGCDIAACAGDSACEDCNSNGVPDGCDIVPHEIAKLIASDALGRSAAIDGDTAVVGSTGASGGRAFVFTRSGDIWTEQSMLRASDWAYNDSFGYSVSIDGDTIVVGAPGDDNPGGEDAGSAYVFVRSGDTWTEQSKLTTSDATADDEAGHSVAVSGDIVLVGAWRDDHGGKYNAGSVYVFHCTDGSWTQQDKLIAADATNNNEFFGSSVAIDRDTAVVGAIWADDTMGGSAYVFIRSGDSWTQQAELTAPDVAYYDEFGNSVAISNDTAIVGSWRDDHGGGEDAGSAYIFTRSGAVWTQQAKLLAADAAPRDLFGDAVALYADTAVVGAFTDDHAAGIDAGSAYVFERSGDIWTETAKLTASDAASNDWFGSSVALYGDTAIVTADGAGAAYVSLLGFTDCNANCIRDDLETLSHIGDYDNNGTVNLTDYQSLVDCLGGPNSAPTPSALECVPLCLQAFDGDADIDIDLVDIAGFQQAFTGPLAP